MDPLQSSATLLVTRKWPPAVGGMETWAHRLAHELGRLGPLCVIALPGRADGRPPPLWKLALFPLQVLRAYRAMRPRPAVLHLGDMSLWPLGLMLGRRRGVVLSAHGTDVSYHRRGGIRGTLYGWYLRLGARLMPGATMIANSRASAEVAGETGWRTSAVVPLGTDLAACIGDAATGHDNAILFSGRLVTRKGCGWFVREVLPLLPADLRLKIAGTPWDASESWVLDHPRVDYLGPLPPQRLAGEYAHSLCVVVPNIEPGNGEYEGFGLVACEAAACGGVVLAARTGGLVEAVRDGETGTLLAPGDARAWAQAIESIAAWSPARRQEITGRAATIARDHYNWTRVAQETREVHLQACEQSSPLTT